jgi:hypothetical protein
MHEVRRVPSEPTECRQVGRMRGARRSAGYGTGSGEAVSVFMSPALAAGRFLAVAG